MRLDETAERLILEDSDDQRIVKHALMYVGAIGHVVFLSKSPIGTVDAENPASENRLLDKELTDILLETGFPSFIMQTYTSRFLPKVQEDWSRIFSLAK